MAKTLAEQIQEIELTIAKRQLEIMESDHIAYQDSLKQTTEMNDEKNSLERQSFDWHKEAHELYMAGQERTMQANQNVLDRLDRIAALLERIADGASK